MADTLILDTGDTTGDPFAPIDGPAASDAYGSGICLFTCDTHPGGGVTVYVERLSAGGVWVEQTTFADVGTKSIWVSADARYRARASAAGARVYRSGR